MKSSRSTKGRTKAAMALIDKGAHMSVRNIYGYTPLHHALGIIILNNHGSD